MSHTRLHPALHFSLTFVFPFRFVFWSQPASSWVVLWNAVQVTPTRPDRAGGLGKNMLMKPVWLTLGPNVFINVTCLP